MRDAHPTGLTGELPPDDPRRNADERDLIAAYRSCSEDMQAAILLMAKNSAKTAPTNKGDKE